VTVSPSISHAFFTSFHATFVPSLFLISVVSIAAPELRLMQCCGFRVAKHRSSRSSEAGVHELTYHVRAFVQPSSPTITPHFQRKLRVLLLGKTWQIKLYSSAFECATIRNVNLAKCAIFPLNGSFTTVIR
jgi:hypothetical protein